MNQALPKKCKDSTVPGKYAGLAYQTRSGIDAGLSMIFRVSEQANFFILVFSDTAI